MRSTWARVDATTEGSIGLDGTRGARRRVFDDRATVTQANMSLKVAIREVVDVPGSSRTLVRLGSARGGFSMPLIINRSADGTPIFSFVGLGTDGSLGADGSQCDAPLPARRRKKVLPLMSYRRKKRADDEAWGAPAARRRPAPAPAHPVMDYNN